MKSYWSLNYVYIYLNKSILFMYLRMYLLSSFSDQTKYICFKKSHRWTFLSIIIIIIFHLLNNKGKTVLKAFLEIVFIHKA